MEKLQIKEELGSIYSVSLPNYLNHDLCGDVNAVVIAPLCKKGNTYYVMPEDTIMEVIEDFKSKESDLRI